MMLTLLWCQVNGRGPGHHGQRTNTDNGHRTTDKQTRAQPRRRAARRRSGRRPQGLPRQSAAARRGALCNGSWLDRTQSALTEQGSGRDTRQTHAQTRADTTRQCTHTHTSQVKYTYVWVRAGGAYKKFPGSGGLGGCGGAAAPARAERGGAAAARLRPRRLDTAAEWGRQMARRPGGHLPVKDGSRCWFVYLRAYRHSEAAFTNRWYLEMKHSKCKLIRYVFPCSTFN